ncbi:MAG: TatD family hydrolase [Verrucomicrobia bacterium]|nr:TatD family hydrolase [Verrucomicrobiota bacterium]
MFFDTHAHFDLSKGRESIAALVARCREQGLSRLVAIGGNDALNEGAVAAALCAPEWIWVALGYDRDQASVLGVGELRANAMATLRQRIAELPGGCHLAALGEIGLDYHYETDTAPQQKWLFGAQLELARQLHRPVVVHSREADQDTLLLLDQHCTAINNDAGALQAPGVLHCFTGNREFADALVEMGMYISFSGILTFANAESLRDVARSLPEHCLLIETDSPFLAPVPMRGKRNEPHYVRHVCECLAVLRGTTVSYMADLTFENGERLFA